jgi:hypothetical protein
MVATANLVTEHVDGTVGRTNASGFTLKGRDGWLNRSKYADPAPVIPNEGAAVRVGVDKAGYVCSVELVPS